MSKAAATLAAGLAALASAGSVGAHHSYLMYPTTPIWISGAVTGVELENPHTIITLEDRNQDGQVRLWAVDGPSQTEIDRMAISEQVPKVGDTIKVCAFPYRAAEEIARDPRPFGGDGVSARRSSPTIDGPSQQSVAGHVIVKPDGEMTFWKPHGVIIMKCMYSSDDKSLAWLDLLNSDPKARESWCEQWRRAVAESNASLKDFAEQVNSSLYEPCK